MASPSTSNFGNVVSTEASNAGVSGVTNAGNSVVTNELNYLGTIYQSLGSNPSADQLGAIQLAIWSVIDSGFQVKSYKGDTTLQTDFTNIQTLLGGGTISNHNSFGYGLAAYSASDTYSGGKILVDGSQNSSYDQNMLTWSDPITITSATPEPSTLAIGGLGALAFIGYGLRRQRRAKS